MNIKIPESTRRFHWISLLYSETKQVIAEGMWSKKEFERLRDEMIEHTEHGDDLGVLRGYARMCGFMNKPPLPVWTEEIAHSVRDLYEEMNQLIANDRWTQQEYEQLKVRITELTPEYFDVVDCALRTAALRNGFKTYPTHVPEPFIPTENDVRVGKELYAEAERLIREGQWNRATYRRILVLMHELTHFMPESERDLIRLGLRTRVIGPGT
jgi:hypothetical protein